MNNAGWASGGLQAIKPIVGVAFGMGDCEHADFCLEFKKHECIRHAGSIDQRLYLRAWGTTGDGIEWRVVPDRFLEGI